MNAQKSEREVMQQIASVAELAAGEAQPLPAIAQLCEAALPPARELAEFHRRVFSKSSPELKEWLALRPEFPLADVSQIQVVLYGTATLDDVTMRWREQLRAHGRALDALVRRQPYENEWLYWQDREGARRTAEPFFRMQQVRDCLAEVRKLAALLEPGRATLQAGVGGSLFRDDFKGALTAWKTYGGGEAVPSGGKLKLAGAGNTLWLEKDFGDAIIAFNYTPLKSGGDGAGALFAYPGTPMPGRTYEASAGNMNNYNLGINTYHVSLFRGNSGKTNIRRTGLGLKMCSTVTPDACSELGRRYRVEIVKRAETIQVHVDGQLIHHYVDIGAYGPVPMKGRFGIRHFSAQALESEYELFEIRGVK
jgi:hypothetical protein